MNTLNSTIQNSSLAVKGGTHQKPNGVKSTKLEANNEDLAIYEVENENEIITRALEILDSRMKIADTYLNSPAVVKSFLKLKLAELEHEVFSVVFLTAQHGVINCEEMFRGTITQTSVYPREVVKRALGLNACAVIFAHNHPSGVAEPSQSDRLLTDALKQALQMVDVRVLDHIIIAGSNSLSFAEKGLI
jgi:DNA repair protein RadC